VLPSHLFMSATKINSELKYSIYLGVVTLFQICDTCEKV